MKKLLLFAMAYLVCYASSYAQLDESRNFLYLYSDSVIYAKTINLERDFNGYLYFTVDSRRVHPEQVKFFNNERGFYANLRQLKFSGETSFSERIRKGKLNLFEERIKEWDTYYDPRYGNYKESVEVYTKNFYTIGTGSLKKANYVNLKSDMVGNPESMMFLKKYHSIKTREKTFFITAGASVVAGLLSFVLIEMRTINKSMSTNGYDSHSSPKFAPSFMLLGAGLGFSFAGYTQRLLAPKELKNAIDTYNR